MGAFELSHIEVFILRVRVSVADAFDYLRFILHYSCGVQHVWQSAAQWFFSAAPGYQPLNLMIIQGRGSHTFTNKRMTAATDLNIPARVPKPSRKVVMRGGSVRGCSSVVDGGQVVTKLHLHRHRHHHSRGTLGNPRLPSSTTAGSKRMFRPHEEVRHDLFCSPPSLTTLFSVYCAVSCLPHHSCTFPLLFQCPN